jgi:hypothetical protein
LLPSTGEPGVLNLVLLLFLLFFSLIVLLWVGTFFFQGYIYTQPSQHLYWQAPAAAAVLTFGFAVWCFSIAFSSRASPQDIPIDTIFRFSVREDMFDLPAKKLWAYKVDRRKGGDNKEEVIEYDRVRDNQRTFHYVDTTSIHRPWRRQDIVAIEIETPDGNKLRFEPAEVGTGEYPRFVSKDGWSMPEFETGPNGLPQRFQFWRLLLNLFFNGAHLFVWFVVLWVLLRFQWPHALGLAAVLWVVATLILMPMMLSYAASVSESRRAPTISLLKLEMNT